MTRKKLFIWERCNACDFLSTVRSDDKTVRISNVDSQCPECHRWCTMDTFVSPYTPDKLKEVEEKHKKGS